MVYISFYFLGELIDTLPEVGLLVYLFLLPFRDSDFFYGVTKLSFYFFFVFTTVNSLLYYGKREDLV